MRPVLATCHRAAAPVDPTVFALEVSRPGLEVTIDLSDIRGSIERTARLAAAAPIPIPVRYHFPIGRYEITDPSPVAAEAALAAMREAVSAVAAVGADYLTVHAPLPDDARGTARRSETVHRLSALVSEAASLGVTVALENLRWGLTAEPDGFLALVEAIGAAVTFDVGHAASSEAAARGMSPELFLAACGDLVAGAHVYERETDRHHAPTDLARIGPALHVLCDLACPWWTIELDEPAAVRATRSLLSSVLDERFSEPAPVPR